MLRRDGPDLLGTTSLDAIAQTAERCDCDVHRSETAVLMTRSTEEGHDKRNPSESEPDRT